MKKNSWRSEVNRSLTQTVVTKSAVASLLFVDPGLGGTGWAAWRLVGPARPLPPPTGWGVAHGSLGKTWVGRVRDIVDRVRPYVLVATCVVVEFPGLWSSAVSAAAGAKGDLFKLAYLCGAIGAINNHVFLVLVSPQAWKGQLPKSVVGHRVQRYWPGLPKISNHALDAVGMGLSWFQEWT